jgi:glycosyltransferase involved in cell wall biosynthesis
MVSISVVVTCYNEEEYVGDSIRSVLDQTRHDLIDEIVVVNDGSEDNSEEVIREIQKENPKIEYVYQENEGLPGARNTGLERCTGDFVALQDGDDLWLEHKIERQMEVLRKYPDVGIVYSDLYLFGTGQRKRVSPNQFKYPQGNVLESFFQEGGPIIPSTVLINRDCFSEVGVFDQTLLRAQDTDMWLRIAKQYRIHHVNEPLVARRERADSLGKDHHEKMEYLMRVIDKTASNIPRLQPFVDYRKSKVLITRGRKLLEEGERMEAIRFLIKALKIKFTSVEAQASLLFAILPLPHSALRKLLRIARRFRGTIEPA